MDKNLKDLETDDDIKLLVDSFYQKVNKDPNLSPIFNDIAKIDWDHHLPKMYDFWSSVLFGSMKYSGSPLAKHQVLPLEKENFNQWLGLFFETIDEHFKGSKAEEAKQRANIIAQTFMYKMGLGDD